MLDAYQDATGRHRRAGLLTPRGRFLVALVGAALLAAGKFAGC